MPTYAHSCPEHGSFDDVRPFSQSAAAAACPTCGVSCAREFTVPMMAMLDHGTRHAHATNEKSRHEPHVCTTGCTHHRRKPVATPDKPAALEICKGPRPWVIEHAC
jgi:putative FmdB family regulatory protein